VDIYGVVMRNTCELWPDAKKVTEKCETFFGTQFEIYQPSEYVVGTSYTRRVSEEIAFVLLSQAKAGVSLLSQDQFTRIWRLIEWLDYDVAALSGGWRKYLGLSLFSNQKADARLFIDASRHLSDTLLLNLLRGLEESGGESVVFLEYDILPILNVLPSLLLLHEHDDRLEIGNPIQMDCSQAGETNY